ncbi:MAG TPA: ATP-dependent helicase [Patescibacteria group bacterium]|nr:ATP-dependent helicase [Patescibacteria group bacterium]
MAKYVLRRDASLGNLRINYEKELNPEQLDVVLHGDGPCLVLAGAGSGKTRTIVYRVAYLLEKGVRPDEILLVTFTNKAAREMLDRITEVFGQYPKGLWGGTFHHIAHILLRKYAKLLGYQSNFTILDQEDAQSLLKIVVHDLHPNPLKGRFPSASVLNSIISLSRNTRFPIQNILERFHPNFLSISSDISQIAKAFAEKKKANNSLDFDDLLELLRTLLDTNAEALSALSKTFRYILVDEYQDTNRLQGDIVTRLGGHHKNILVVGDDAQSIYSFRGAEIQNILQFPKQFPDTKMFKIETNYRSTPEILHLANKIIARNSRQYPKALKSIKPSSEKPVVVSLSTSQEEAEFIVQRILELRQDGLPLSEIAVLFRASHHSQALEFELTRREIPYEYRGGIRFFERAHIKDVLAYLKVTENPRDEISWYRILLHQEGIGEVGAKRIINGILGLPDLPNGVLTFNSSDTAKGRLHEGWKILRKTLAKILEPNIIPQKLVELVSAGDYRQYLENQFPNAAERIADLEALAEFAGRYDSLSTFLAEVTLQESFAVQSDNQEHQDDDQIVLSTVHQAKGLEWETVFVINLTSNAFPHPKSVDEGNVEEERRLFYVAVTRAKQWLYLTYAVSSGNLMSGYAHISSPSIFLNELPTEAYETLEIIVENDFGL